MHIDIRVPTIPLERRVWRLFPGESYSFLRTFTEEGVGFLDFPGASLPAERSTRPNAVLNEIKRSLALKEAIAELGRGADIDVSTLDLSKFRSSEKRTRDENAIVNFYYEAPAGDLVVLPEPVNLSRLWIGTFQNSDITSVVEPRRYGQAGIPARSIRWLGSVAENKVSSSLSASLRQSHAFTLLEKSLLFEVFSLVYGSYIYGDRRSATIFNGDEFLDSDSSLIANVTKIAAAACRVVDDQYREPTADPRVLLSILLTNPPAEYACTQESDIHSRGFTRLTSGTDVPLVASAILAALMLLASCASKEELKTKVAEIKYVNSSNIKDPSCTSRVSEAT